MMKSTLNSNLTFVRKAARRVIRLLRKSKANAHAHKIFGGNTDDDSFPPTEGDRIVLGEGEMSALEIRKLLELVKESDPTRPIIEVGTLFGSTALAMSYVKDEAQKLICVDNFSWNPYGWSPKKHESLTRRKLAQIMEKLNVEVISIDRREFYSTYSGPTPALVFLDADHSYQATLEDIRWAQSVGADIICGDDYSDSFPGVIRAVSDSGGAAEVVDELFVLRKAQPDGS
jgi:hypothetical protein